MSKRIKLSEESIEEAKKYAKLSRSFTSNRHDFHSGGLNQKEQKMFEGKLGEKAIKQWFEEMNISYEEDKSHHEVADDYDFLIRKEDGTELKVDVKTRTKSFHIRTLEMVEQISKKPKDIYISVRLYGDGDKSPFEVEIIGYATAKDFLKVNRIRNLGYLDNYVLFDNELTSIDDLSDSMEL